MISDDRLKMWHYCVPLVSFFGYLLSRRGYKSRVCQGGWINDCVDALKYSLLLKIHCVSAVFNKGDVWLWEVMHCLNMVGILTVC